MIAQTFLEDDAATLCGWIKDSKSNWLWGGPNFDFPLTPSSVIEHIRKPEVQPFLLMEGGKAVGYFDLYRVSPSETRLCRVLIAEPDNRGKGLGKQLMMLALQLAGEDKATKLLSLAVFEDNVPAVNCYLSMGFDIVTEETKTRVFDGREWGLLRMQKRL